MHIPESYEMSGCQNDPIRIASLRLGSRRVLQFLIFLANLPRGNGIIKRHLLNTDIKDGKARRGRRKNKKKV